MKHTLTKKPNRGNQYRAAVVTVSAACSPDALVPAASDCNGCDALRQHIVHADRQRQIALKSGFVKPVPNFTANLLTLQLSILPNGLTIATAEDGDI
jgi:hypothetical protein